MLSYSTSGSFDRTFAFLEKMKNPNQLYSDLAGLAQQGVNALQAATPVDSGETAQSWGYEIEIKDGGVTMSWLNSHKAGDVSVAILLQYGHGTGTGGYVEGRDFINGALKPVFDQIAESVWRKVTSA